MATRSITVKQILSRVRQVFPNVPENYVINLINDALVEVGMYNSKTEYAKITTVADQMWYDLSDLAKDSSGNKLDLNKVFRIDFMDNEGDYIRIPRLLDKNVTMSDLDESILDSPTGGSSSSTFSS
tara:strand:+ start:146 stop:523 length:378 start_codon:yes stop_codon:yes gene_type:complete